MSRGSSFVALFLRITWMILGPAVLFALAGLISQRRGASVLDLWFAGLVALVIIARLVDVARYQGTTGDGEPATLAHVRRYAIRLVAAAAAAWLLAHIVGGW
jgi:hypothetical protein